MSDNAAEKVARESLIEALFEGYTISDGLIDSVGDETGLSHAQILGILHNIAMDAVQDLDVVSYLMAMARSLDDIAASVERIAQCKAEPTHE